MSTTDLLIWATLWDSSGTGFNGATPQGMRLPSNATVDDLRAAVHANYDKPGFLRDIPVGILRVYRDAEHFLARNEAEPLDEDFPITENELGSSKREPLIVFVPPLTRRAYYSLVRSSGEPYMGLPVDKVSLSPSADVSALREAVFASHSSKLASLDATDLKVYRTYDHFHAGEEIDPLDEYFRIGNDLGSSKREPLIVFVPPLTREFNYSLVSSSGEPYMGLTVDKVSLSPSADVSALRVAVLASNSNKLASLDATDLKVYRDLENFLAGEEKAILCASHSLIGLGLTKEEPLTVCVPNKSLAASFFTDYESIPQDLSDFLKLCANLKDIPKPDTTIEIPCCIQIFGDILANGKLFVRSEYEKLFQLAMELHQANVAINANYPKRFLFIGSPGIGKSVFGVYWLMRLLQQKQNVAYRGIQSAYTVYLKVNENGNYSFSTSISLTEKARFFLLLHGEEQIGDFQRVPCPASMVLFASPYAQNYNVFKKGNCHTFCMEPWTLDELKRFSMDAGIGGEWLQKFIVVGGVPRYVFSHITAQNLRTLIRNSVPPNLQELSSLVNNITFYNLSATDRHRSPHILVHFRPSQEPGEYFLKFASPEAEIAVQTAFSVHSKAELTKLLKAPDRDLQALRGRLFEEFSLMELATQKEIVMRSLEDPPEDSVTFVPGVDRTSVFQNVVEVNSAGLFLPAAKNFPAIDALIVNQSKEILYIQCTVSGKHPIKELSLQKLYVSLDATLPGYKHFFVFLVLKDVYSSFKKQNFMDENRKQKNKSKLPISQFVSEMEI